MANRRGRRGSVSCANPAPKGDWLRQNIAVIAGAEVETRRWRGGPNQSMGRWAMGGIRTAEHRGPKLQAMESSATARLGVKRIVAVSRTVEQTMKSAAPKSPA